MRILYFSRSYTAHDERFLTALGQTAHEILFLKLESEKLARKPASLPGGVQRVEWPGLYGKLRWRKLLLLKKELRRVIEQVQPDLIHAGPIQNCAFLAALAGFQPLVSMSWGYDLLVDAQRDYFWRWVSRATLAKTTVLVTDCQAVRAAAAALGMPDDRMVSFPWGVDLQHFAPGEAGHLRTQFGWDEDAFVLFSNRSWEKLYGVDLIAEAFVLAARRLPQLRLLMLGSGSMGRQIRETFTRAGLQDKVALAGRVPPADLPGYYRSADLYLSASHTDGSSVSLMEAMACGLPVLVSDIAGNREWVQEGQNGWLFPDGDAGRLAEMILQAYHARIHFKAMSAAARARAEAKANWAENFPRLLAAYELATHLSTRQTTGARTSYEELP